jgi:hypothetical protein
MLPCCHPTSERVEVARLERHRAGEKLVRDDAEGPDVARRGGLAAVHELFWRHVHGSPRELARRRRVARGSSGFPAAARGELGDTEIADFRAELAVLVAREHHVVRLEITVHDAECMRPLEPPRRLREDFARGGRRQLLLARQALSQRLAVDQLHHEVGLVLRRDPEVEHANRVSRVERRHHLRLGEEALARRLLRDHPRMQQLDGHRHAERQMPRLPHLSHAPFAGEGDQLVPATDHGREAGDARHESKHESHNAPRQDRGIDFTSASRDSRE